MSANNQLYREKSPYLLQHQHNPVAWYAWGEEAFERARVENKPIFLSIGYSTCYWCHVMEKDSFELPEVAEILNRSFVCIKVDREERPDVDKIYMDAVVSMTGRGGWPMSVFLLPDLRPFFGGTFFPKDQFIHISNSLSERWLHAPESITQAADHLYSYLEQSVAMHVSGKSLNASLYKKAYQQLVSAFDPEHGGFGKAPKFPQSHLIRFLLSIHNQTEFQEALPMSEKTLSSMHHGGIYDHLEGGFSRYSTDEKWLVPHFEKMLYDNATLAVSYFEAYQCTNNPYYQHVAENVLHYLINIMQSEEGGFFSAEDAGEVGKEGEFYVWTYAELEALLSKEELMAFPLAFSVSKEGNFEHKTNILSLISQDTEESPLVTSSKKKLLNEKAKRSRPYKDDKILTSWNGLTLSAFAKGFQLTGNQIFLKAAERAASFIKSQLHPAGKLLRRYRDGEARFDATLDDYAFLIQGLLDLYEANFDLEFLSWALTLQKEQDSVLLDRELGGYFFSSPTDSSLIIKQKDFSDGAEPNSNAVSASNLLRLYHLTMNESFKEQADTIFTLSEHQVSAYPAQFASILLAHQLSASDVKQVIISSKTPNEDARAFLKFLRTAPNARAVIAATCDENPNVQSFPVLLGKPQIEGKPTYYICSQSICNRPTTSPEEAIEMLHSKSL